MVVADLAQCDRLLRYIANAEALLRPRMDSDSELDPVRIESVLALARRISTSWDLGRPLDRDTDISDITATSDPIEHNASTPEPDLAYHTRPELLVGGPSQRFTNVLIRDRRAFTGLHCFEIDLVGRESHVPQFLHHLPLTEPVTEDHFPHTVKSIRNRVKGFVKPR